MIEGPEAVTIARQLAESVAGRTVVGVERGNAAHKFAFYSGTPQWYSETLTGLRLGPATARKSVILLPAGPDYLLVLGCGGERITLHPNGQGVPARHHLRIDLDDGSVISVKVQGWGELELFTHAQALAHRYPGPPAAQPYSADYTTEDFLPLFDTLEEDDKSFVKHFITSEPGIPGVGNGYLQDILFEARIHPRRRAVQLSPDERTRLFNSLKNVMRAAVELSGRDVEYDLYGQPGRYVRRMDSRTVGQPCPQCGTPIEKLSFLGGSCYLCPSCQPLS